jgi:hypothetical protein
LRDIMTMPLLAAKRALDDWLSYASRSRLAPFVKLARTIRLYRDSIEATIEWKLATGSRSPATPLSAGSDPPPVASTTPRASSP